MLQRSLSCLFRGLCFQFALPAPVLATNNPISGNASAATWSLQLEDVVTIPDVNSSDPRLEDLVSGGAPDMAYVIAQQGEIYRFDTTPLRNFILTWKGR